MVVPMNVNRFLNRTAKVYKDKVAVIDGDARYTYGQLFERVQRLSNALRQLGVAPGDRVAWLGYNNHPLLEAYFGAVQYGAILVPLNIRLSAEDLAVILQNAEPAVLVFDSDFEPLARALGQNHVWQPVEIQIEAKHAGYLGYEDWLAAASADYAGDDSLDENSTAELFYTSGTTGRPKGVELTHRNLYMNAMQAGMSLGMVGMSDASVLLHTIPLFHVNGWGTPHYVTALGATHVMLRRFDPQAVLELVQRHRVTHANLVPTMVNMLNNYPQVKRFDLSSLRQIIVGGAASPSSFVGQTMSILGGDYNGGYGLSETSPIVSLGVIKSTLADAADEVKNRARGSAGIPLAGVEVALMGADGQQLPWDGQSLGELVVRGDMVMKQYWRAPEETAEVLYDGWFHTGDLAVIDAEGYIRIADRKKDIIISGGENISSTELEDVLYQHPAVLECCVIGRPDPVWGEIPHGLVVVKPGEQVTAEELVEFAGQRLARFKAIKSVQFVPPLPKTGTGKVQKMVVRRMYGAGWAQ
ncbi:MAG: long-chain-fatty-acid--CoA ligase [Thermaerobacter sp.]|nr:long-chain-fatty-acid--CoA ligase [Thermaerobacter sp.]